MSSRRAAGRYQSARPSLVSAELEERSGQAVTLRFSERSLYDCRPVSLFGNASAKALGEELGMRLAGAASGPTFTPTGATGGHTGKMNSSAARSRLASGSGERAGARRKVLTGDCRVRSRRAFTRRRPRFRRSRPARMACRGGCESCWFGRSPRASARSAEAAAAGGQGP